jgi:dipeptidyl aminopeptidase/acylaminoacyl peptidase
MPLKIYLPAITLLLSLSINPALAQVALDDFLSNYTAEQTQPVTIDDIVDLKTVENARISPDGTQVIYTVRQFEPDLRESTQMNARTRIWKVSVSNGASSAHQLTFGEQGDTQPQWSPDQRYISFLSARGTGENVKPQLYVMRTDGGEAWKLTDAKEGIATYAWAPDSNRIAYTAVDPHTADEEAAQKRRDDAREFENDFRYAQLWVIDIASKKSLQITEGKNFTVNQPDWSPDGMHVVFQGNTTTMQRDLRRDLYIANVATRSIEKVDSGFGTHQAPAWSPDGSTIAYLVRPSDTSVLLDSTEPRIVRQQRLMLYDVAGKTTREATSDLTIAPVPPTWSPDSSQLYFSSGTRAYSEAWSLDVASGEFTQLTNGRQIQVNSISSDGRRIAGVISSSEAPAELVVADAAIENLQVLTDTNPQARSFALGESEVFTWKSSDGMEVEGILLKPVGYQSGQQYPLLVVAHGGPAGVFTDGYRVGGLEGGQALAGQGWAIFYPNPRGSTNYGNAFLSANVNDWGGGDYRDIMTGVDALIARGIADPDRMAHIGWSYGGYMTAWVVTQTSRFKAAMVGAGLTNLWSMYGTNDVPNSLVDYFGGMPNAKTMPLYLDRSAMQHIDQVVTPTLLLHGAQDERVPTGQSLEMFRALRERGVTTELVFYPREGHGILEYYHQKDRLQRIHDWITKHTLGAAAVSGKK